MSSPIAVNWYERIYVRVFLLFAFLVVLIGGAAWFGLAPGDEDFRIGILFGLGIAFAAGTVTTWWGRWYIDSRIEIAGEVVSDSLRGHETSGVFQRDEIVSFGLETSDRVRNLSTRIARLEQEKARLNALLGSMSEAVVMVDESERVMEANPVAERVLELPKRYKGRSFGKVSGIGETQEIMNEVLWKGEPLRTEIDVQIPNDVIHLSVSADPISIDNATVGAVMVLYDVTRLRRLERVRRDFVANVSHELRTPIASIQSASETLLLDDMDVGPVSRDFVETIFRNANRMASLVEDLLMLSKLEAEGEKLPRDGVNLVPIVVDILDRFDSIARKNGITLDVALEEDLPNVLGEPRAISHILQNLVENGIKYTPRGGRVELRMNRNDKKVDIVVSDTGVGIPPEHIHRVFERFYRVDEGRSREVGGTGLGLAIVKHLVRKLGGDISVESEPDKGSTFFFDLPVVKDSN